MRIVIIGAGISGHIAYGAFKAHQDTIVRVFDTKKLSPVFSSHKAVMRLRDTKIKDYVDCSLKEITVSKAIYHNGKLYDRPSIFLNNLYSLKSYGSLGNRSLSSLGTVTRYKVEKIKTLSIHNFTVGKVVGIVQKKGKTNHLLFDDGGSIRYDICISTVPMPVNLSITGIHIGEKFMSSPIYVLTAKLNIDSSVNQTLYFVDDNDKQYRATIQGRALTVESTVDIVPNDLESCYKGFGIKKGMVGDFEKSEMIIGKIHPIDSYVRRMAVMEMTDKFNFYSFGRFATWRPLRIDQTLDDIKKIKLLIKIKTKRYYSDL